MGIQLTKPVVEGKIKGKYGGNTIFCSEQRWIFGLQALFTKGKW